MSREDRIQRGLAEQRDSERRRKENTFLLVNHAELLAQVEIREATLRRAMRLLNPHHDHPFLETLAAIEGDPRIVFKIDEDTNLKVQEERIATERAHNGVVLLEELLNNSDFLGGVAVTRPFKGMASVNFLHGLDEESRSHLSLVRCVTEYLPQIQPEGDTQVDTAALLETKLELFAATVGFGQTNIVERRRPKVLIEDLEKEFRKAHDPHKEAEKRHKQIRHERHAIRDSVLQYGIHILAQTGQKDVRGHLYKAGKEKRTKSRPGK